MKREFLEGLSLEKDIIDQIMTENGKDINREKAKADEYKSQLDTAKETLKSFEGVDVKDLQGKVTQLTADLAAKDTEYQAKIADMSMMQLIPVMIFKEVQNEKIYYYAKNTSGSFAIFKKQSVA